MKAQSMAASSEVPYPTVSRIRIFEVANKIRKNLTVWSCSSVREFPSLWILIRIELTAPAAA